MQEVEHSTAQDTIESAVEAYRRGHTPLPIRSGDKRPFGVGWTNTEWTNEDEVRSAFTGWTQQGATNLGLLLGDKSGLVDVDLDNILSLRLGEIILPKTAMVTGRAGRPRSHYWYRIAGEVPGTRRYKMPDLLDPSSGEFDTKRVSVELRGARSQTVIPPSMHPSGEKYLWHGEPWGGEKGPAHVDGKLLARQVALIGMITVLIERWPKSGSRHDAYLALAGGLLRFGDGVHPYWEKNVEKVIRVIVAVTRDEDGAEERLAETLPTTIARLREGKEGVEGHVIGFGRLGEIIGNEHAEAAKRMAREIESLADVKPEAPRRLETGPLDTSKPDPNRVVSMLPPEIRNPMEERVSSWDRVDMDPYIAGQVVMPEPNVLVRSDGKGLMYPGRVNSLYGLSESGKSWVAMFACQQEMAKGNRVMYLDFEDSPEGTWDRMKRMGVGPDDMIDFAYVHPEDPISDMLKGRFSSNIEDDHKERSWVFRTLMEKFDPTLLVVDGMTTLYNSHGLDTNAAGDTDVIGSWLKSLARNGRTTVVVIDHTGKGGAKGDSPIGAHHKIAMVQGTAIQVVPSKQPMPGSIGELELVIYKDRPGAVRVISAPPRGAARTQLAAVVSMDSTVEGVTRFTMDPPPFDNGLTLGNSDSEVEAAVEKARQEALKRRLSENARQIRDAIVLLYGDDLKLGLRKIEIKAKVFKDNPEDLEKMSDQFDEAHLQLLNDGVLVKMGVGTGSKYWLASEEVNTDD